MPGVPTMTKDCAIGTVTWTVRVLELELPARFVALNVRLQFPVVRPEIETGYVTL